MTIRKGHSFPSGMGFTGSAGMTPVRPHMRSAPAAPKAGNLAIMRNPMDEGAMHRPNFAERARRPGGMNKGGKVKPCNY